MTPTPPHDGDGRDETAPQAAAEALLERGLDALRREQWQAARRHFREALALVPLAAAANNLAVVILHHDGDAAAALAVLEELLAAGEPDQPFTAALAARCCAALGRRPEGEAYLRGALEVFDGAPPDVRTDPGWLEYTAVMLQAAGELGKHAEAWRLYREWRELELVPPSHYAGGVAAFNLGEFTEAARAWEQLRQLPDWPHLRVPIYVARLGEEGLVPPFEIPYEFPDYVGLSADVDAKFRADPTAVGRYVLADPLRLVLALHAVFAWEAEDGTPDLLAQLVAAGGTWGAALAEKVLTSARPSTELKLLAGSGLVEAGRLSLGEVLHVLIDGELQQVTYHVEDDDESDDLDDASGQDSGVRGAHGDGNAAGPGDAGVREEMADVPDPAPQPLHPTRLELYIGGYTGRSYEVRWLDGALLYTPYARGYVREMPDVIWLTDEDWAAFWAELDALNVWDWDEAYVNHEIVDGTSWEVRIERGSRSIAAGGANAFPGGAEHNPEFQRFLAAVRRLLGGRDFA